ncbi:MAG: hypothetical protein IJV69_06020, partial [Kiritimatiellae bacterium]|nr:hypothetical protein [Kiritimatiellia bacterium]
MMSSFFKSFIASAAAMVATVSLFAAPNAKLVPQSADWVFTADGLNNQNPEAEKAWIEGLKKLGLDIDPNVDGMAQLNDAVPGLGDVVAEVFGYDKAKKTCAAKSITCYFDLVQPKAGEDDPQLFGALVVENPKANLATLKTKLEALLAKQEEPDCKMMAKGAWLAFETEDDEEAPAFIGVCATKTGYVFVGMPSYQDAEAYRMGKMPAISAKSPLMAAFKPMPAGALTTGTWVAKDIAKTLKDFVPAEQLTGIATQVPWALQAETLTLATDSNGDISNLTLSLACTTEATAAELSEMLIGYKALATGMLLPMAMGTPDSKTGAILKKIKIAANGKTITVALTVSRDEILASLGEMQALQQKNAAAAEAEAATFQIEELDDLTDDDDDDK